ncbi:MAG: GTP-binding protein [Pseudomonadota bacterium]
MSTRKVCVIGDFGVGKTSTVARVVHNVFSEKYLTTVGVKIDTYVHAPADAPAQKLVIWDIAGADRFGSAEMNYLRGAHGYVVVIDGTRPDTVAAAQQLLADAARRYGEVPFVTLVNKNDLTAEWQLSDDELDALSGSGHAVFKTSALSGSGVADALAHLCERMR